MIEKFLNEYKKANNITTQRLNVCFMSKSTFLFLRDEFDKFTCSEFKIKNMKLHGCKIIIAEMDHEKIIFACENE